MSELLQLESEFPGYSSSQQQQEERQKLAKKQREEQLKRYYEWERSNSGEVASKKQRPGKKRKRAELKVRFQPRDVLRDALNDQSDRVEGTEIIAWGAPSVCVCAML